MKVLCIGRNYADHAKEMNAPLPKEPIFFMKPDTAVSKEADFYYPDFTKDLHHEVEIVVKISKAGKNIDPAFAGNYYQEIGLGIDFTARDVQKICKEQGLPWEKAKAFDNSAIVSNRFIPKDSVNLAALEFSLTVNQQVKQKGNTADLIFPIDQLIAHLSRYVTLKTGDLIFTGTPEGVGPVRVGDKLAGYIGSEPFFELNIR